MLAFSTKESSKFNIVVTAINLATILIVLLAAFPHVDSSNYEPFAPKGLTGLFNAAAVVFFSYIGFDTVATTAEEVKNPKLDLPIGIVGSLGVCSVLYSLMCLAITGLEKYSKIDINAPFSEAFRDIGIGWVGRIVSVGAVAGIVTSLLVNLMGQARIYMVLGREELIPSWIARIDPQRSTPLRATMVTMCTAGSLALFLDIEILSSLVSMGTLFALGLVSLAVIVRRYHRSGDAETFWPVAVRVGVLLFGAFFQGLAFELKWHPVANAIFLVVWLVGTLSLTRLSVAYEPLSFSVPLKPLTPSLGVLFTLHLMFSLGRGAYLLFGSLQVVGAVGYVLYGMHRSQGDGPVGEVRMSKLPSSEDWRGARSERDDRKLMAGFAGTSDEAVMPGEWDVHVGRPKPGVRL
ncbi:unnamed protein product [Ostreobium quekettii]|uniref:Cationic amino acid transporter C-terminal domain-containing protein n=1 Tax=Ostreobium quekettii TaxID=121088 RepID=A0A8S1J1Q4_9CHLO|nr:unnamed protein product [Ostreobium quekettii]